MVRTPALAIAARLTATRAAQPVILLTASPTTSARTTASPPLVAAGHRVIVPYLRGYGPTRFLDPSAPRMAQQAAIGQDLLDLMTALDLGPAVLAGYDWGGRAACIASLLAPERVRGLVTIGGYNVQNTVAPSGPADAAQERAFWYQWYFNTERGRTARREPAGLCRLCGGSGPDWRFDDDTSSAPRPPRQPDFVEVVSFLRHRHGKPLATSLDCAAALPTDSHHRAS